MIDTQKPFRKPSKASPPRMAELATLPVFFTLKGKKVVLAGGSSPAAWKAELLAATGAHVTVYATQVEPEMAELLARGDHGDRLVHLERPWALDVFEGAALAVADARDDEEARAFFCAARDAGVPVNIVDRPKFSQFSFGSIVNRSPVVVGISTRGAAPILAQAIRRKIETLLPQSLSDWAGRALRLRTLVLERLRDWPLRRAFWNRFSDLALSGQESIETDDHQWIEAVRNNAPNGGCVTLVGAGPGNADLLTIGAMRALQAADIVLFDDLVSDDVLELARREAKRMMVGKRGRRESCRQDDINALMIKLAKQGKNVVRLKAGDPMIFGRAAEELAALDAEGIPTTVVPGITAAGAMASQPGVSLTHRDHAQTSNFVTGHARDGHLPNSLDLDAPARPGQTTMVFFGGSTGPALAKALFDAGADPQRHCVAMRSASRPNQMSWHGTLEDLAGR